MGARIESTHRYPSNLAWLCEDDGFRHLVASSDEDALRQARDRGATVDMIHIQRRAGDGWEPAA